MPTSTKTESAPRAPAQTLRQAKRAYQKSSQTHRLSEGELRKLRRREELQQRAERAREREQRRRAQRESREAKERKGRAERKREEEAAGQRIVDRLFGKASRGADQRGQEAEMVQVDDRGAIKDGDEGLIERLERNQVETTEVPAPKITDAQQHPEDRYDPPSPTETDPSTPKPAIAALNESFGVSSSQLRCIEEMIEPELQPDRWQEDGARDIMLLPSEEQCSANGIEEPGLCGNVEGAGLSNYRVFTRPGLQQPDPTRPEIGESRTQTEQLPPLSTQELEISAEDLEEINGTV